MGAAPSDTGPGRGGARPRRPGPRAAPTRASTVGALTVLGCDGSYPGPGGAASGYLVERGPTTVWLDAGPGTFARLQLVKDPVSVDALVLSHEHPDHWADVDSFAVWLRQSGRTQPVPVFAPAGLRRRAYFAGDRLLEWHDVAAGDRVDVGELSCTFDRTDHGPPTLAVRLDPRGAASTAGDASPVGPAGPGAAPASTVGALVYSADTGAGWSVASFGTGIAMFLCEATYTRGQEGRFRHLSGRQAGEMAADAGVGRLVVTHRWPSVPSGALAAEADDAFGRPVHQAVPGRVFEW